MAALSFQAIVLSVSPLVAQLPGYISIVPVAARSFPDRSLSEAGYLKGHRLWAIQETAARITIVGKQSFHSLQVVDLSGGLPAKINLSAGGLPDRQAGTIGILISESLARSSGWKIGESISMEAGRLHMLTNRAGVPLKLQAMVAGIFYDPYDCFEIVIDAGSRTLPDMTPDRFDRRFYALFPGGRIERDQTIRWAHEIERSGGFEIRYPSYSRLQLWDFNHPATRVIFDGEEDCDIPLAVTPPSFSIDTVELGELKAIVKDLSDTGQDLASLQAALRQAAPWGN